MKLGGRSGYEYFAEDKNYLYTIAQFHPRLCVYNDIEGWQNKQFLGQGEYTVGFCNFDVAITVPSDHLVAATGELQNANEILSKDQRTFQTMGFQTTLSSRFFSHDRRCFRRRSGLVLEWLVLQYRLLRYRYDGCQMGQSRSQGSH